MTNIPYSDIKDWYVQNKDSLPKTMGSQSIVVMDVCHAFETAITEMDSHIEKHGDRANSIQAAKACYHRLMRLYTMANDPTTHNKGKLIKYGDPEWEPTTPSKLWKAQTK